MTRLTEIAARAATLQARRDAGRATLICRDVPYLLARLAEAEARVAALEGECIEGRALDVGTDLRAADFRFSTRAAGAGWMAASLILHAPALAAAPEET